MSIAENASNADALFNAVVDRAFDRVYHQEADRCLRRIDILQSRLDCLEAELTRLIVTGNRSSD